MSFPTFDTGISLSSNVSLSNGNLTVTANSNANGGATAALAPKVAGKWYFEGQFGAGVSGNNSSIGLRASGSDYGSMGSNGFRCILKYNTGTIFVDGSSVGSWGANLGTTTTQCVAIDLDNKRIWFREDGGNWNNSGTNNPATNVGGYDISGLVPGEGLYPCIMTVVSGDHATINFGASAFVQSAPSGFSAWNALTSIGSVHIDVDSFGTAQNTGTSSHTLSVNCNGSSRKIVIVSFNQANGKTVSSVTATGLTFSKLTSFSYADGGNTGNIEVWTADASASFTGKTVTVTYSGAPNNADTLGFSVWGYNASVSDANSPWHNTTTSTQGTVSVTTANANDLLIAIWTNINVNDFNSAAGYTKMCKILNGSGANWSNLMVEAQCELATLSGSNITTGTGASNLWGMLVIGFSGDAVFGLNPFSRGFVIG